MARPRLHRGLPWSAAPTPCTAAAPPRAIHRKGYAEPQCSRRAAFTRALHCLRPVRLPGSFALLHPAAGTLPTRPSSHAAVARVGAGPRPPHPAPRTLNAPSLLQMRAGACSCRNKDVRGSTPQTHAFRASPLRPPPLLGTPPPASRLPGRPRGRGAVLESSLLITEAGTLHTTGPAPRPAGGCARCFWPAPAVRASPLCPGLYPDLARARRIAGGPHARALPARRRHTRSLYYARTVFLAALDGNGEPGARAPRYVANGRAPHRRRE